MVAVLVAGCGSSSGRALTGWAAMDQRMDRRVQRGRLDGAVLVVRRGDADVHRHTSGSYDERTVLPMASSSKWLTAATV